MTDIDKMLDVFPELKRDDVNITPFIAEEDGREYTVWKVETIDSVFVIKKVSHNEVECYNTFLSNSDCAPLVHEIRESDGQEYMSMEYIEGETLSRCNRKALIAAIDALASVQDKFWNNTELADVGYGFTNALKGLEKRADYMNDLRPCYEAYLEEYKSVPRTLCNDDMLPFNVVYDGNRAVILDWEYAGILPYASAFARFIAFGEEDETAMFYMTAEDKRFALDYYYERLIKGKGIARCDYDRTMKLFMFKEYSEWIYMANKSEGNVGIDFDKYYKLAKGLAEELGLVGGE